MVVFQHEKRYAFFILPKKISLVTLVFERVTSIS